MLVRCNIVRLHYTFTFKSQLPRLNSLRDDPLGKKKRNEKTCEIKDKQRLFPVNLIDLSPVRK